MDKLLDKVRHSLLIVSFLGIVFSLTGAIFTGQSAIASYLGVRFSSVDNFKFIYLIMLFYMALRYFIYYADERVFLKSESIRSILEIPVIDFLLKKIVLDAWGGENKKYFDSFSTSPLVDDGTTPSFAIKATRGFGNGKKEFIVNLNFKNATFKKLCDFEVLSDELPYGKFDNSTYHYLNGMLYHGSLKRFSLLGVKIMVVGCAFFIFHSFTRRKHFEYSIPLFTAFCAFFMTIKHFFFSEKASTILTTIHDSII
ncbi:hypothetical protein [Pectobacterium parvum]|uniref:hypothetical protein n=1 Tax=Pectobacterium parvum TaxID=2778550 RepID=UPI00215906BE|nr:hypothetical protein [Pectobacterium parvum]UVD99384.1 hypothetical protein NV347_10545 [Pectobacterium parvum]